MHSVTAKMQLHTDDSFSIPIQVSNAEITFLCSRSERVSSQVDHGFPAKRNKLTSTISLGCTVLKVSSNSAGLPSDGVRSANERSKRLSIEIDSEMLSDIRSGLVDEAEHLDSPLTPTRTEWYLKLRDSLKLTEDRGLRRDPHNCSIQTVLVSGSRETEVETEEESKLTTEPWAFK